MRKKKIVLSLMGGFATAALVAVPLAASSQGGPSGHVMGPGMMGTRGMGPGSMRECGPGAGMMGGEMMDGMGPGMMGGSMGVSMRGMWGSAMMGAYGMGPTWRLDLTDAQRSKINAVADQLRARHWAIMGKMMDDRAKVRDLYATPEPDAKAIGAVYGDMGKPRQEMVEAHVQATNQARSVLTKEQREQLGHWRHAGPGGSGSAAVRHP